MLTLIAAVSADGFIATGKGLPWHLPKDTEHFRRATSGQWLLIGRRTYQEMLGWFRPEHQVLVLTHDPAFAPPTGRAVASVAQALDIAAQGGARELFVCGGGETYAAAMPMADRLILTHVDTMLCGGIPFPAFVPGQWQISTRQNHPADDKNPYAMAFICYERQDHKLVRESILENSR